MSTPTTTAPPLAPAGASERLTCLDAFRGFTIVGMLFVNNPGWWDVVPHQMKHAEWGEFVTFCDMIFPWFLFIVGVAIPYSTASYFKKNPEATNAQYAWKCAKRAAMLVLLGLILVSQIARQITIRLDVLQLIGLAFFCAAMIYRTPPKVRYGIAAGLLIAHWILLRFVPVPGEGGWYFENDRNIIRSINDVLRPYYLAGIVSVVPTTALVLIGTWFGDQFRSTTSENRPAMLKKLLVGGAILVVLGLIWHLNLEMSKLVWSASYIVFAAGLGAILLGVFYFLMDMKGWTKWAFLFVVYGMNAIFAYFVSIMTRLAILQTWTTTWEGEEVTLWRWGLEAWTALVGRTMGSWMFTTSYIVLWFLILLWMYRKRYFWRV